MRSYSKIKGFSIMEVMVALFLVGIGVALVAGLGQQIAQFARKSSQTGAILEIRSMTNSITRNSDSWLARMRSSVHTNGLFAGCIPDPKVNISTFSCPAVDAGTLAADEHLSKIAGGYFHVASSPIINNTGEKIAGTNDAPVYLTIEGMPCADSSNANCVFKSTGYFMRSNSSTSQDPGSIKFVIKVEKNPLLQTMAVMKPQYMSIDIGESWKDLSAVLEGVCPKNTVKVGYLSDGSPSCINPVKPCTAADEIAVGVDSNANTICEKIPTCTNPADGIILASDTKKFVCSAAIPPCGPQKVFLGYFAGNGEAMCTGLSMKCPSNQIQVGITQDGSSVAAECSTVPPCTEANKKLLFNGEKFVCADAATASISCTGNQLMTGIASNGSPICVDRQPATSGGCTVGQFIKTINADGSFTCADDATGGSSTTTTTGIAAMQCEPGEYMQGINTDGTPICLELPVPDGPVTNITNNSNVRTLGFADPLPAGGAPASCLQNSAVNVVERSCTGLYYKCEYRSGPGGTGWYWVNNAGASYLSCSSGITYAMTNVGSSESRMLDPLPAGVSPATHNITCRYSVYATTEYKCETFLDTVGNNNNHTYSPTGTSFNTPVARIPFAKNEAGLCYRAPYSIYKGWIHMRRHPTTKNKWAEIFCITGMRSVKK